MLLAFNSCKDLTLKEKLIESQAWSATKFVVNGKNTMPPDNDAIMDSPISLLKLKFMDDNNMTLEIKLKGIKGKESPDDSGELPLSYEINEINNEIKIIDNNSWTSSRSFTGTHRIELIGNELFLSGKLGDRGEFKYETTLIKE